MDFISLVSVLVPYKDYPAKQRFGLLADRGIRQARGLGNWFLGGKIQLIDWQRYSEIPSRNRLRCVMSESEKGKKA